MCRNVRMSLSDALLQVSSNSYRSLSSTELINQEQAIGKKFPNAAMTASAMRSVHLSADGPENVGLNDKIRA